MEIKDVKNGDLLLNKYELKYYIVMRKDRERILCKGSSNDSGKTRIDIRDGIMIDINDHTNLFYSDKNDKSPLTIKTSIFINECERVDTLSEDELELFSLLENYLVLSDNTDLVSLEFSGLTMMSDWKNIMKTIRKIRCLGDDLIKLQTQFMIRHYPELFSGLMEEDI